MDARVKDYPDLVKRAGGVVNTNKDDYLRAKTRIKQQQRIETLELELGEVHKKLDLVLKMLVSKNEPQPQ